MFCCLSVLTGHTEVAWLHLEPPQKQRVSDVLRAKLLSGRNQLSLFFWFVCSWVFANRWLISGGNICVCRCCFAEHDIVVMSFELLADWGPCESWSYFFCRFCCCRISSVRRFHPHFLSEISFINWCWNMRVAAVQKFNPSKQSPDLVMSSAAIQSIKLDTLQQPHCHVIGMTISIHW